jgi:hypothetical protein
MVPTEAWNASAIGLPAVLLLSAYRTMTEERPARGGTVVRAAAISMPIAAALSLKYTVFPGALVFVAMTYLARMIVDRRFRQPMAEGLTVGVMTMVLLLPWMIASYRACGTFLYPFLGEGFRAYTTIAIPHKQSNRSSSQLVGQVLANLKQPRLIGCGLATLGAILVMSRRGYPRRRLAPTIAAMVGSILTLSSFQIIFPITAAHRYSYPFLVLLLIVSFSAILGWRWRPGRAGLVPLRYLAWLMLVAMTARLAVDLRVVAPTAMKSAWGGMTDRPFVSPDEIALYQRLQDRIPAGSSVICMGDQNKCVIKPFLFDFSRNTWFVHDIPGCISPPPGIPLEGDGVALADYLRSWGIRYIVLHREEATPEKLLEDSRRTRGGDNWIASFLFNYANLTRIMNGYIQSEKKLFEEGGYYVIDIGPIESAESSDFASPGGTGRRRARGEKPTDPPKPLP